MIFKLFNYLLILQLIVIVQANDSTIVESSEHRHVDFFSGGGDKSHRHVPTAELNQPTGCPTQNIFSPCECNEVSFDAVNYQTQISCRGVDGKQIQR